MYMYITMYLHMSCTTCTEDHEHFVLKTFRFRNFRYTIYVPDGKIGENFLLVKISGYTVHVPISSSFFDITVQDL